MPDAQRAEIAKLEALHAENPQGRIFTHLAEAYRKDGQLELARDVLVEGIQRHPDYSSAHVVLARVLADIGEEDGAVSEFRRVLELDPHNLVALRRLADMARAAGRDEEALDYYHRLLDVEPSDEDAREIVAAIQRGETAPADEDVFLAPGEEVSLAQDEEVPLAQVEGGWSLDTDEGGPEAAPFAGDEGELEAAAPEPEESAPWVLGDDLDAQEPLGEPEWEIPAQEEEPAPPPVTAEDAETGVMTETIAQVYARQGLYDRAAEVYRQLVRIRPDDEALRTRLEEMEALAAAPSQTGDAGPGVGAEPLFDEGPDEPADHQLDAGPIPGLVTGGLDAPPDVAPLAGLENDDIDPDTGLLAMGGEDMPSLEGIPEGSVDDVPPPPEEEAPWAAESEADEEPWAATVAEDEPWSPAGDVEERTEPSGSGVEEFVESVWTGAEGASAGDESPYIWSDEPETMDESEPIGSYLRSLLGWGAGEEAPGAPAASRPEESGDPGEHEPTAGMAESPEPDESAERPGAPAGDGSADDDDLDTFRSWLESLKQ